VPARDPATFRRRPGLTPGRARELLGELYGVEGRLDPLPADRDQNFRVRTEGAPGGPAEGDFVLKVFRSGEDPGFLEAQDQAMERLGEAELPWRFPRVRSTLAGARMGRVQADGATHLVRLVTWVPGTPLAGAGHAARAPERLREVGAVLGAVDRVLEGLEHPALEWDFEWDLAQGVEVVERYAPHVTGPERRTLLVGFLELHGRIVDPVVDRLPLQAIHGDGNDHNVLVDDGDGESGPTVSGLVDFGDMIRSWRVGECAVGAAYGLLDSDDPVGAMAAVASGYHAEFPLEEEELHVLFPLTALRLCVSVVHSARRADERPHDPYLRISEAPGWRALERLAAVDPDEAETVIRRGCAA
jgi:Ser/Thr protein kinase RdoA (MazF antagonist)